MLAALYRRASDGPEFIQARYGSLRGLGRLLLSRAAGMGGRYRAYENIDGARVKRLVFVCAGNICRSPLAERFALARGFAAISVGLRGGSGLPAAPDAVAAAHARGIALGDHRSRAIDEVEIEPGDLLVAMEPHQALALGSMYSARPDVQLTLLGLWSRPRRPHIHDPYGLSPRYFARCAAIIDSGVNGLLTELDRR